MIAAMILTLICVLYRVAAGMHGGDGWANFAPISAIALCGAVYFPRIAAWLLPLAILAVSDAILDAFYHVSELSWEMGMRYAILAVVIALAFKFRSQLRHLPALLGASVASSTLFYLVTNSASWLADGAYAKTGAGWVQALTVGLPGYAPTWMFFRNSLLSDLLFTGLFVACISWSRNPAAKPVDDEQNAFKTKICPL